MPNEPVPILVNGTSKTARSPLSFEDGVTSGLWRREDSVTYQGPRHGDSRRSGILVAGGSVALEDGMRFAAAFTGNA